MAPEPREQGIAARATLRYATAAASLARLHAYLSVGVRQSALAPPLRSLHREILRALAIGSMFGHTASVRSRCHGCGASIALEQDDEAIAPAHVRDAVHVGIAWRETGGCAARSLCREMVFFCSAAHAATWQADAPASRAVLRLPEAIRLAKAFFLPLLAEDRGR